MSFNFSADTKFDTPNSLVPAGTLAFAKLQVRGLKRSQQTNGQFADVELVLMGEYENRRIWPVIMDPSDSNNSEQARQMGLAAIQHICEAAGIFDPNNPDTYTRFANATFTDILQAIDGKRVAIKVGIEKGTGGYQDKNRVTAWLSPNPNSGDFKQWERLVAGDTGGTPAPQQQSGFAMGGNPPSQQSAPAQQATPASAVTGEAPAWL